MIEEEFTFDKALEIDEKVWRILPKIQARKAKELLRLGGNGLADFLQAIKVKFEAESYCYEVNMHDNSLVQITIHRCPWYDILKKAKREHLAGKIADSICSLEFQVWLSEFGDDLRFNPGPRLCMGDDLCLLEFRR